METEDAPSLGLLLLRSRKNLDLTQEALAERSGVSVNTISNLEGGRGNVPRQGTLDLLIGTLIATRRHSPAQAATLREAFNAAAAAARARQQGAEQPEVRGDAAPARADLEPEARTADGDAPGMPTLAQSLDRYRTWGDEGTVAIMLLNEGNLAKSQGKYRQARACYEQGLALLRARGDSRHLAAMLENLGSVVAVQGDFARTAVLHLDCLLLQRQAGDSHGIARALGNLGMAIFALGDVARARSLPEEGRELCRSLPDMQGLGRAYADLGTVAYCQEDYAQAEALYGESLLLARRTVDRQCVSMALINLGRAQRGRDHVRAIANVREGLALAGDLGDRGLVARGLLSMAALVAKQGRNSDAVCLLATAAALREALGMALAIDERAEHDQTIQAEREAAGEHAFTAAWSQGRAMTGEAAIVLALEYTATDR
jgi:tetratricopeptide (TPR) repeat protein